MRDFVFLEPRSVPEASAMLADLGDDCRVMAGGTALMLAMRQRMVVPTHVISAARLQRLQGITFDAREGLRIGALTRHSQIAQSAVVREFYPMLADMASRMANIQVRNQGTLGGNLCYADPATDPPCCLMALAAEVVLGSGRGERTMPIEDFLVDYYVTALEPDELVLEVRVPPPAPEAFGAYTRYLRTAAEHRPLVNIGLHATRRGAVCGDARLVVGASTPVPCRVPRAEAFLAGKPVTAQVAFEAAQIVAEDIEPLSDQRGTAEFRREMVRINVQRTIHRLFELEKNEEVT